MTWKDYYSYRNSIHFIHLYGESWRAKHLCPIYMAAELILRALVRRKYSNIKVILRAYRDGYMRIWEKQWNRELFNRKKEGIKCGNSGKKRLWF